MLEAAPLARDADEAGAKSGDVRLQYDSQEHYEQLAAGFGLLQVRLQWVILGIAGPNQAALWQAAPWPTRRAAAATGNLQVPYKCWLQADGCHMADKGVPVAEQEWRDGVPRGAYNGTVRAPGLVPPYQLLCDGMRAVVRLRTH